MPQAVVQDAHHKCTDCGYSKVYCDGYVALAGERCCKGCTHR